MGEFTFKKSKTIDVKSEAGEIVKTYTMDVGNYEKLKMWMSKAKEIDALAKRNAEGEPVIDDILALEKEVINMMTGGDFEFLWELSEHNVFALLAFVNYMAGFVQDEMKTLRGQYQ